MSPVPANCPLHQHLIENMKNGAFSRRKERMRDELTGQVGVASEGSATMARQLYLWHNCDEAPCCISHHLPHLHFNSQQSASEKSSRALQ
jgi:hypothetical protein